MLWTRWRRVSSPLVETYCPPQPKRLRDRRLLTWNDRVETLPLLHNKWWVVIDLFVLHIMACNSWSESMRIYLYILVYNTPLLCLFTSFIVESWSHCSSCMSKQAWNSGKPQGSEALSFCAKHLNSLEMTASSKGVVWGTLEDGTWLTLVNQSPLFHHVPLGAKVKEFTHAMYWTNLQVKHVFPHQNFHA